MTSTTPVHLGDAFKAKRRKPVPAPEHHRTRRERFDDTYRTLHAERFGLNREFGQRVQPPAHGPIGRLLNALGLKRT